MTPVALGPDPWARRPVYSALVSPSLCSETDRAPEHGHTWPAPERPATVWEVAMTTATALAQETGMRPPTNVKPRRAERRSAQGGAGGGAVYGIGMIGAAIYFFKAATSREDYLLAIPKALFWPALLVYETLKRFYGSP